MRFSGGRDNNIKQGRVWYYLNNNYSKSIGVEWSFRPLHIFNFNISFDGSEMDYTFSFWFIWVFYIKFSNIFKRFPRVWNSQTNNKKGGFLNSAKRTIGISQYNWTIWFDIWHDGENSWYSKEGMKDWQNKKDFKIYHKIIFLKDIIIGDHTYQTIEEDEKLILDLKLPENIYKIKVQYRFWHLTYNRWISRVLNKKGKSYLINDENEIAHPKGEHAPRYSIQLKETEHHNDYLIKLRKQIINLRGGEEWIPKKYRLKFERRRKLEKINS